MPRFASLVAVFLSVLFVSGCAREAPNIQAAPSPQVFASDEEAVVAAERALAEYFDTSKQILENQGSGVERLRPLVTSDLMESLEMMAQEFERLQHRQVGAIAFEDTELVTPFRPRGADVIKVSTCLDYSGYDVVDPSGVSVGLTGGEARSPAEVTFVVKSEVEHRLQLSGIVTWDDESC